MLSKIILKKRWLAIITLGAVLGITFYYAINLLPSKYTDLLFYAFGLQSAAAVLLTAVGSNVGSAYYFIVSVVHFSILSWLFLRLIDKHLTMNKWLIISAGYLAFSIVVYFASAYVFFHYVMDIGGRLPMKGN
jgi:hypothetical protein